MVRVTRVTPVEDSRSETDIELYVGQYDDWTKDWHRGEIDALRSDLNESGLDYREYHLMQKAVGFDDAVLVGLATYTGKRLFDVLIAWLTAREGRKLRVKFKDGAEIEAGTIKELENLHDRFLKTDAEEEE